MRAAVRSAARAARRLPLSRTRAGATQLQQQLLLLPLLLLLQHHLQQQSALEPAAGAEAAAVAPERVQRLPSLR
jgi:hypothetical protein